MEILVRRKPRIRSWPIDTITQIRLEEENVSLGSVEIVQGVRIVGDSSDTKGFYAAIGYPIISRVGRGWIAWTEHINGIGKVPESLPSDTSPGGRQNLG